MGLDVVQPQHVYLVAVMPPVDSLAEFLKLLMGLCERVIRATGGTVNIFKMMERTAQSKNVVQLGLEYLQALGRIQVKFGERTRVDLAYGDKLPAPPADLAALENRLRDAWEEVEAYRRYVREADAEQLILSML
jgi:hypothetical protein